MSLSRLKQQLAWLKKNLPLFLILAVIFPARSADAQGILHTLQIDTAEDMHEFFQYTGSDMPLVTGHRGGIVEGYPENSIEAMDNTLRHTHAFFEIDPRITKDSVIVLMHDVTLDRTTTGTGNVSDYTWEELQEFRLIDHLDNVTPYRIPSLAQVIEWSRGKTIINLDKKDVPIEMTAALIRKLRGEAHVMLTVHSAAEARLYLNLNPKSMFSAFIRNEEEFSDYEKEGIPWGQMIAYIGPRTNPDNLKLAKKLNDHGVMTMIGAAPSYDHLDTAEERSMAYQELIEEGINIIESDLPIEVGVSLQEYISEKSPKSKYFVRVPKYPSLRSGGQGALPKPVILNHALLRGEESPRKRKALQKERLIVISI